MNKKQSYIKKDFTFENNSKDTIKLKFLNRHSKTPVYISKKTGLVFHNTPFSSQKILEEWSSKHFGKKMNIKKHIYTDNIPEMRARHYYVLDTLNSFIKIKDRKLIDFAFGQGGLLLIAKKVFSCKKLYGVEHSKKNIQLLKRRLKKNNLKKITLYNSSIENFKIKDKADLATLTWTLCNCSEPIKILRSISNNLKKNGYLIVGESSRILVPFKKVINNYFVPSKKVGHTHPWHWSYNSLLNIFKYCGFELIKSNRYYDVNDLVFIFKNSKKYNQNYNFDKYQSVIRFLKRWSKESKNYNY